MAAASNRSTAPGAPGADDERHSIVAASALDLLLIELVPLAQRITEQLHAREQALLQQYRRNRLLNKPPHKPAQSSADDPAAAGAAQKTGNQGPANNEGLGDKTAARSSAAISMNSAAVTGTSTVRDSVTGVESTITSLGFPAMDEDIRQGVFFRLDGLGYRVGQGLAERFSVGKPRPTTPLDAIKFVCKDLWILVFRKQVDNLKTNHRGIFVLTDLRFQPLSRMSIDRRAGPRAAEEALSRAQTFLYFPCGIIRGVLAGLGIEASVEANSTEIPTATFQIKTNGAKS